MVIIRENQTYLVYAIVNLNNDLKLYHTDKGYVYSNENIKFCSNLINSFVDNYKDFKSFSESELIDGWYLFKEHSDDFINEEERREFKTLHEEVKSILPGIYQEIEIDYVKWKVKNGKIEEWQNNFVDKIIELSDTECFIDDDKYDIFYDIDDLDNVKVTTKVI